MFSVLTRTFVRSKRRSASSTASHRSSSGVRFHRAQCPQITQRRPARSERKAATHREMLDDVVTPELGVTVEAGRVHTGEYSPRSWCPPRQTACARIDAVQVASRPASPCQRGVHFATAIHRQDAGGSHAPLVLARPRSNDRTPRLPRRGRGEGRGETAGRSEVRHHRRECEFRCRRAAQRRECLPRGEESRRDDQLRRLVSHHGAGREGHRGFGHAHGAADRLSAGLPPDPAPRRRKAHGEFHARDQSGSAQRGRDHRRGDRDDERRSRASRPTALPLRSARRHGRQWRRRRANVRSRCK